MVFDEVTLLKRDIKSFRERLPVEDPYSDEFDAIMELLNRAVLILQKVTHLEHSE